jgi:hypothetical protein
MPQIGNNDNPVMFRKAIVSKDSRFRKGFDKDKYQENYNRIFGNKTELEIARENSKTFSMEQE